MNELINKYLIKLQYQGDDRCEHNFKAYSRLSEEELEDAIIDLPNFDSLEQECIDDYCEYCPGDDEYDEDEQYASVIVENITDDEDLVYSPWFESLETLIDERDIKSYVPGSAKVHIGNPITLSNRNCFEVNITCDANDGDYMKDSLIYEELDELRILLLNYLGRYFGKWSVDSEGHQDWNGVHYGHHIADTPIGYWASAEGWLLYAGMCDTSCHSINDLEVIYYDDKCIPHSVFLPNVDELFDSEKQFLKYVETLIQKENEDMRDK